MHPQADAKWRDNKNPKLLPAHKPFPGAAAA
jgi:hypothetical protein